MTDKALGRGQAILAGHCLSLQLQIMRPKCPAPGTWAQDQLCVACMCEDREGAATSPYCPLHWLSPSAGPATSLGPHQSCEIGIPKGEKDCQRSYILQISQLLNGQTSTHTKPPSYFLSPFLALPSTCLTCHTNLPRYLLPASPTGTQSHNTFLLPYSVLPVPQRPAQGWERVVRRESLSGG